MMKTTEQHVEIVPGIRDRRSGLAKRYRDVRKLTEALAAPLSAEDQTIQSMPDTSPTKWHRAHTTWFFETFVLVPHARAYRIFNEAFGFIFNSYYESIGPHHPRPSRGVLSRPGIEAVAAYRAHVDSAIEGLLDSADQEVMDLIWTGLHHEQQHQELMLTDIKHAFSNSPVFPRYVPEPVEAPEASITPPEQWAVNGGIYEIGHRSGLDIEFSFDNERPAHDSLLRNFAISDRPVSNAEFVAFIEDDGYRRPELWLSEGWSTVKTSNWQAPGYWYRDGRDWRIYTLHGLRSLRLDEPVCHVSFFEAAAYAQWVGRRLPTEFEWEIVARQFGVAEEGPKDIRAHPRPLRGGVRQDVWEWTASPYSPYPGFTPQPGSLAEYNGKFMINQMVLRGRSCVTPPGHERVTYRNFFPPQTRWQFSGFRLADNR
jgi:ergothioneine biosynthesis protein EgtB